MLCPAPHPSTLFCTSLTVGQIRCSPSAVAGGGRSPLPFPLLPDQPNVLCIFRLFKRSAEAYLEQQNVYIKRGLRSPFRHTFQGFLDMAENNKVSCGLEVNDSKLCIHNLCMKVCHLRHKEMNPCLQGLSALQTGFQLGTPGVATSDPMIPRMRIERKQGCHRRLGQRSPLRAHVEVQCGHLEAHLNIDVLLIDTYDFVLLSVCLTGPLIVLIRGLS